MHNCAHCDLCDPDSLRRSKSTGEPQAHENSWLCRRFKKWHASLVSGIRVPFHTCQSVKYITMDQNGNCEFYEEREDGSNSTQS